MHEEKLKYLAKILVKKSEKVKDHIEIGAYEGAYILTTKLHEKLDKICELIDEECSGD